MLAEATAGSVTNAELAKWALKSENRDRLAAMVALARSEDGMTITANQWDSDPWLFNCDNGTIDLRTGELKPHNPDDLLTHYSPVRFDPDAEGRQKSTANDRVERPCPLRVFSRNREDYLCVQPPTAKSPS